MPGVFSAWSRHLASLIFPLATLGFTLSGPHTWEAALPFLLVVAISLWADAKAPPELRQPGPDLAHWPFDALLYLLFALQIGNLTLLALMFRHQSMWSADAVVTFVLVGGNSGYSGIVVAHELLHREAWHMRMMGRILMSAALYEHFSTEHVRGHHARVGTREDSATARFGERYRDFLRRTVPGQFKSAWRLESVRLRERRLIQRILGHRVLQGVLFGWSLAGLIWATCGRAALTAHLLQAFVAVCLLESVNYFEHWGLVRTDPQVRAVDSWDTDSAFTLYALVGLSRHAGHHASVSRPFEALRRTDESPKLPSGYIAMVFLVIFFNPWCRRLLAAELERRGLRLYASERVCA